MKVTDPEEWRHILGYEGVYEISSHGRVRRTGAAAGAVVGRILKKPLDGRGYPFVWLYDGGVGKTHRVHRLLAEAFIGPPPFDGAVVAHADGNRENIDISNLRWATHSENEGDKVLHGISNHGSRNGNTRLTEDDVRAIRASGACTADISTRFGISSRTVRNILNRDTWQHVE